MTKLHDLWLVLKGELSSNQIDNLQRRCRDYEAAIEDKQAEANFLANALRAYDDKIFAMSQCTSWVQMQPHFAVLQHQMERNLKKESDRITGIMIPQLERTYGRE